MAEVVGFESSCHRQVIRVIEYVVSLIGASPAQQSLPPTRAAISSVVEGFSSIWESIRLCMGVGPSRARMRCV